MPLSNDVNGDGVPTGDEWITSIDPTNDRPLFCRPGLCAWFWFNYCALAGGFDPTAGTSGSAGGDFRHE
ncbi:MAG TPA: hypothetical protein DCZ95_09190 [Verrucomicrobia bacterium]|nr:hypothetical protein [Verrucomicrobiota bacterium]